MIEAAARQLLACGIWFEAYREAIGDPLPLMTGLPIFTPPQYRVQQDSSRLIRLSPVRCLNGRAGSGVGALTQPGLHSKYSLILFDNRIFAYDLHPGSTSRSSVY